MYNEQINYYHETFKKKDEEILNLKKKLHNCQRTKLRLKNKLNFKITLLEEKLKEYDIADDWDEIKNEINIEQPKLKND